MGCESDCKTSSVLTNVESLLTKFKKMKKTAQNPNLYKISHKITDLYKIKNAFRTECHRECYNEAMILQFGTVGPNTEHDSDYEAVKFVLLPI